MPPYDIKDGTTQVRLTTRGRQSGKLHTVWLTAVTYRNNYYFSRHRPDSDWFLNALAEPAVSIHTGEHILHGKASHVSDTLLLDTISGLKYPGQARAAEKRVAIRVVIHNHTR